MSEAQHDRAHMECLPDLLRARVLEQPTTVAAVQENQSLTYRELNQLSGDVAAYLNYHGAAPDGIIGVFAESSLDLVVGIWGILYSGAAYLPLPPEYPNRRLYQMIEDAQLQIIFCQEHLTDRLAEMTPPETVIVTWPTVERFTRACSPTNIPEPPGNVQDVQPDNLAYVIYTSGSTGRPKGVMIEHRSIVNQMCWLTSTMRLGRDSIVLQKTPIGFDAAQWEILAPACGSTVATGPPGVYRDPERLIDTIIAYGVTSLQCVPTLLAALLDSKRFAHCTSLTQIFSGGEALSGSLARSCVEKLPWCRLVNLYGPTECTINSSAFVVCPENLRDNVQSISIGAPVANTYYHILDDCQSSVPTGQIGELYVSGIQVARGYLNQPDLTAERFFHDRALGRLFRTGDLAYWNTDGTVQFAGRADNQIKLRGYRIELDEIRLAIENHEWVRQAAVIVKNSPTGFQSLIACVELSPKRAFLMDQGNHGSHHQSKESRLQVMAQLSNPGLRDTSDLAGRAVVALPGKEPLSAQRQQTFARKTYRFFEGGTVTRADLLRLLDWRGREASARVSARVGSSELGEILRYFGQFHSTERLLPKYGYASPGSLYATQMYVELANVEGVTPGIYYYHPVRHQLVLISEEVSDLGETFRVHFLGKRQAIEPVYKHNIQEVLEIEAGHMIGLFEVILPQYGLDVRQLAHVPTMKAMLDTAEEDFYLGTATIGECTPHQVEDPVDIYVQAHPGKVIGLPAGQYRYHHGELSRISDQMILKHDVIAINQQVYERASVGITAVSRAHDQWRHYVDLGRTLQRLSMNDFGFGFMSSGYSSRTGDDLPSAIRINEILTECGTPTGSSYFFVGGRVSNEQRRSEGMKEDAIHSQGPAEMIRDDLAKVLPDYMVPNRVVIFDTLPLSANGKVDTTSLANSELTQIESTGRSFVAPCTPTQRKIARLWEAAMKLETVSIRDDFFASGGNSLIAVGLINKLNQEFGTSLPLQVLFECPTVEKLAARVDAVDDEPSSRVVPLREEGANRPIFCWPGLGGYAMNLRPLTGIANADRPFYGMQAYGINSGERPHHHIDQMAAEDLAEIRRVQANGPYTLWGYSFGARVAYEVAYKLERSGEQVESLVLIAPGLPRVPHVEESRNGSEDFSDSRFVAILFSVFAGRIDHPALSDCLRRVNDETSFVSFIADLFQLDRDLVSRVTTVARLTYGMRHVLADPAERPVSAPTVVFRARGDERSLLDEGLELTSKHSQFVDLDADHYRILTTAGVAELSQALHAWQGTEKEEAVVPHVNIKHFPISLTDEQQAELVAAVTDAVKTAFSCDEGAISIALEPVPKEVWHDRVYIPEIVNRKELLRKVPSY